jgi:hypothetical protein
VGIGGRRESGARGTEKEYDAWGPHLVVDMEFEIWRLTGAEKLELNWKILRIFLLEVGFGG